jgi:hypothetical protein
MMANVLITPSSPIEIKCADSYVSMTFKSHIYIYNVFLSDIIVATMVETLLLSAASICAIAELFLFK